jgi:hypothetical protein
MNKVTIEEAKDAINNNNEVLVLLEAHGLAGTYIYTHILEELEDSFPTWKFLSVDIILEMNNRVNKRVAPLYFEPDTYPKLYIFKNKERKVVVDRALTLEEVTDILTEVDLGTFNLVSNGSSE